MIESYKNAIFKKGSLTVNSVYIPNEKGSGKRYEGNFFGPHKVYSGQNNKYSTGPSSLEYITSSGRYFLSFEYSKFDYNSRNRISEDVMMSYPHLDVLSDFITRSIDMINKEDIFDNNGIKSGKENLSVTSGPFVQGKQLMVTPAYEKENSNGQDQYRPGVRLYINGNDFSEFFNLDTFSVLMDQVYGLSDRFNFRTEGRSNEIAALAIETNNLLKQLLNNNGMGTNAVDYNSFSNRGYANQGGGFQQQPRQQFSNQNQGFSQGFNQGPPPQNNFQQQGQQFSNQNQGFNQGPPPQNNFQQQGQNTNQVETNPFASNDQGPVDISDHDLPFNNANSGEADKLPPRPQKNNTTKEAEVKNIQDDNINSLADSILKNADEVEDIDLDDIEI